MSFIKILVLSILVCVDSLQAEVLIAPEQIDIIEPKIDHIDLFDGSKASKQNIEFNKINSNDSGSLLKYFLGANSASNATSSSMPVIRGLSNDRIKVSIDGMDLIAACASHMNSPLTYTELSKVSDMKVYAGLTPVSVGGDSIGSAIIINSIKPFYSKLGEEISTGEISAFYRSNNDFLGANIKGTMATDKFFINYNGTYEDAKNYNTGSSFKNSGLAASGRSWLGSNEVGSSAYKFSNQMLTIGLKEKNHLFNLKLNYQDIPYQGFFNQRMDSTKNESTHVNFGYESMFDWGGLEIRIYNENTDHQHNFGPDKQFTYSTAKGMPMNAKGKNLGVIVKGNFFVLDGDILAFGSELKKHDLDDWWSATGTSGIMQPNDFQNINNGKRDRYDVFLEWTRPWNINLLTLFGVRYGQVKADSGEVYGYQDSNGTGMMMHQYKKDSDTFNSSKKSKTDHNIDVSFLTQFIQNKNLSYEMGYAMKNRSPSLYERYTWSTWTMAANMNNTSGDGNGYVGNLNLDPETSHTISLSVDWHDKKKNTRALKIVPYFIYIDKYIDAVSCSEVGKSCPSRSDGFSTLSFKNQSAKIYGIDLNAYHYLGGNAGYGNFSVNAALSYIRGENNDTKNNLYRQMPLNLMVSFNQKLSQWTNRIESTVVNKKHKISGVRNELKTPGHVLFNLASNYQFERARLNLSVNNIFNKLYYAPLGGSYTGQGATMSTGILNDKGVPGMGRSYNIGLIINF